MAEQSKVDTQAWIIWAVLLFGQVIYAGVMVFLVNREGFEAAMPEVSQLRMVAFVAAGLSFVASNRVRSAIFKSKKDADGSLPPEGWLAGQIVGWAIFEGAAIVAITCGFLAGAATPYLFAAGIAMLGQICYYPRH